MILAHSFRVVRAGVDMAINQDLKAVLPRDGINGDYLTWLLRGTGRAVPGFLDEAAHGTKALRMERWLSFPFRAPAAEQRMIAEHVSRLSALLKELIQETESVVRLFKERRTALISAAVTGKIDVRGTATLERYPNGWRRMSDLHREINLEIEICDHLAAHGWLYGASGAADYDRVRALFPWMLLLAASDAAESLGKPTKEPWRAGH